MKPETQNQWNINEGSSLSLILKSGLSGVIKQASQALPASDAQFLKQSLTSQRK